MISIKTDCTLLVYCGMAWRSFASIPSSGNLEQNFWHIVIEYVHTQSLGHITADEQLLTLFFMDW